MNCMCANLKFVAFCKVLNGGKIGFNTVVVNYAWFNKRL